ncbi:MAG: methyltransferase domain-containing protein [Phycisphaerales bacterium]|nr:methyltransferase domain-containing protein [Phycisphaerales bacterium]
MDTATHEQWLADTRKFWDAGSEFEARYRRICSSPDFDATEDAEALEALWAEETERALPQILQGVPLAADWTCVEIGCGIGRLMRMIAPRCKRMIGFDLSERMASWSREYLADVPNAEVRVNDGKSLAGIADASVDFVYSHLAFQHITLFEVVDAYLAEIRRVLKPGGYCRIQNWRDAPKPVAESFKDMIRPLLGRGRYRSSRCWTWSAGREVKFGGVVFHPRQWRRLLREHGLRVVDLQVGVGHDFWMWTTSRKDG